MLFSKKDMLSITEEDYPEGFTAVEEGDWVQEGRYQKKETIFKFKDKFYSLIESRSGSPFTDWAYDSEYWPEECSVWEVEAVETKITKWKWVR